MTKQKKLKREIRAQKAKMGASYSAARRVVVGAGGSTQPMHESEQGSGAVQTVRALPAILVPRLDRLKSEQVMLDMLVSAVSRHEMELPLAIHIFCEGFLQFLVDFDFFPFVVGPTADFYVNGDGSQRTPRPVGEQRIPLDHARAAKATAVIAAKWKKALPELEAEAALLKINLYKRWASQELKRDELDDLVDHAQALAREDFVIGLLRHALRAFDVSASDAVDMTKKLPRQVQLSERREHLVDFASERLEFGSGRSRRTRSTARERYEAYRQYCADTKVPLEHVLSIREFSTELKRSIGVSRYQPGSDGSRQRGWSGVGLKPPTGERSGEVARRLRERFYQGLRSPEFAAALQRERERLRST